MLDSNVSTLSPSESQFNLSINSQYPYFDLLKAPQNNFPLGDYTTVDVGQPFKDNTLIASPQESTASNSDLLTGETATSVGFDYSVNGTETTREGLQVNPVTPIDYIPFQVRDLGIIHNQKTIPDALWETNERLYRFELDTPSSLNLNIDGMKQNVNVDVTLVRYINENGNNKTDFLRQVHWDSPHPEALNFFSLDPGTYGIKVQSKKSTSTLYNLTLTAAAPLIPPRDSAGNTLSQAKDL